MDRDAEFEASRGFVTSSVRTRRGQLLCRRLSPQQQATVKREPQLDKEAWASVCFVCCFGLSFSFAKVKSDPLCRVRACTRSAIPGVAGRGRAWFTSSRRHHFRLSRDVDRSCRRSMGLAVFNVLVLSVLRAFLPVIAALCSCLQSLRIQKCRTTSE